MPMDERDRRSRIDGDRCRDEAFDAADENREHACSGARPAVSCHPLLSLDQGGWLNIASPVVTTTSKDASSRQSRDELMRRTPRAHLQLGVSLTSSVREMRDATAVRAHAAHLPSAVRSAGCASGTLAAFNARRKWAAREARSRASARAAVVLSSPLRKRAERSGSAGHRPTESARRQRQTPPRRRRSERR